MSFIHNRFNTSLRQYSSFTHLFHCIYLFYFLILYLPYLSKASFTDANAILEGWSAHSYILITFINIIIHKLNLMTQVVKYILNPLYLIKQAIKKNQLDIWLVVFSLNVHLVDLNACEAVFLLYNRLLTCDVLCIKIWFKMAISH